MKSDAATAVPVDDRTPLPLAQLDGRFPQTVVALANGSVLAVRTRGAAADDSDSSAAAVPVVVLLHGIGSGAASWLHVALALGNQARVVAWDAPGYGDSTPLAAETPSAADYADRLHALLAALRIDSCVLVGHSLGALMAAAYAAGPGRGVVRRLVLVSPARGYGAPDKDGERQRVLDGRLQSLARLGVDGLAAQSPDRMLSPAASAEQRAWVRFNTARLNPAGYTQAVRMLCGDDIVRYADGLPMPVEVHGGDADVVVPLNVCRHVAAAFGAPFTPIAAAGHASPVEQPAEVARRIAGALAAVPALAHAVSDRASAIDTTVPSAADPQAHAMSHRMATSATASSGTPSAGTTVGSRTLVVSASPAASTGGTPR